MRHPTLKRLCMNQDRKRTLSKETAPSPVHQDSRASSAARRRRQPRCPAPPRPLRGRPHPQRAARAKPVEGRARHLDPVRLGRAVRAARRPTHLLARRRPRPPRSHSDLRCDPEAVTCPACRRPIGSDLGHEALIPRYYFYMGRNPARHFRMAAGFSYSSSRRTTSNASPSAGAGLSPASTMPSSLSGSHR
jgi:hypothetical protein